MIRLHDISLPPEHNASQLLFEAARMLRVPNSEIRKMKIVRRSVDARKKPDVRIIYTVDVTVEGSEKKILKQSGCKKASAAPISRYQPPKADHMPEKRPVVVGFGPAGMFAALVLALAGWKPLVLERGEDARARHEKVEAFFETGHLDTRSNVQFGEGGAGTFSDGKLNTGVNNPRIGWILEQFVAAGAREDILYDAKPHVGTDVLLTVVQNLRKRIISLGGEVRFCTQVTGLCAEDGQRRGRLSPATERFSPSVTAPGTPLKCWRAAAFPWSRSPLPWACALSRSRRISTLPNTAGRIPPCPRRTTSWWSIWRRRRCRPSACAPVGMWWQRPARKAALPPTA